MRRSRPPGSGCYAKAALASLFSLRCCSLAWRRRRSLRARSQSQAILDQQPCSRRDRRASPSIRGRASTDAAPDGTSRSIARRHFQTLCSISGCLFRTRARHSRADKKPQDMPVGSSWPTMASNTRSTIQAYLGHKSIEHTVRCGSRPCSGIKAPRIPRLVGLRLTEMTRRRPCSAVHVQRS